MQKKVTMNIELKNNSSASLSYMNSLPFSEQNRAELKRAENNSCVLKLLLYLVIPVDCYLKSERRVLFFLFSLKNYNIKIKEN